MSISPVHRGAMAHGGAHGCDHDRGQPHSHLGHSHALRPSFTPPHPPPSPLRSYLHTHALHTLFWHASPPLTSL